MRIVYPVRGIVQGLQALLGNEERRTIAYVFALIGSAVGLGLVMIAAGYGLEAPVTVLALTVVAAIAERGGVQVSRATVQSISVLPALLAGVLFGPLAGAMVGAGSMLGDPELFSRGDTNRAPRLKWATYTSTRFIGGAAMGFAASTTLGLVPSTIGGLFAATLIGAIVGEVLEAVFALATGAVRGRSIAETALRSLPIHLVFLVAPVYAPLVAILAFTYLRVSPWTLAFFLVPAIGAQRLYALYQQQRRLAEDLAIANQTLESANLEFAGALIATLDARDQYTAGHSAAVAIYSRDIAARMGLGGEIESQAYLCGLVHDIGKIGLPAGLLEKPGALTLEERRQMQSHSVIGETILSNVGQYAEIARIVRHHHERIDGEGYPDGLAGEAIPLVSRIIAVADAYNAMTSNRPYRDAMPSRVARHRLAQAIGTQFDTSVVAAFEAILATAGEEYRLGHAPEFQRSTIYEAPSPEVVAVAAGAA